MKFNPEFFRGNRRKLRQSCDGELIIVAANGLLQRSGDTTFPFRQDSNFWYLTGINKPDITLVMDSSEEYLIVPERDHTRTVFDGAIETNDLREVSGIKTTYNQSEGWQYLTARLKHVSGAAVPLAAPAYLKRLGLYVNPARTALIRRLKRRSSNLRLIDVRPCLTDQRMVKQNLELAAIRQAVSVTLDALGSAEARLNEFKYEYELEGYLTACFRNQNTNHAYSPIVAAGANACTLHYTQNSGPIKAGQLLLIDAGAEVNNYAADITRTLSVGRVGRRQQQVANAVKEAQVHAISLLKPGVLIKDYENAMERFMGEKLRQLKIIKTGLAKDIRRYYPHSTSHFLGLDVHDVGDYHKPLEANMVLTAEPGIYIPEEGIGVRTEDDVLITKNGNEVLGAGLPAASV